MVQYGKSPQIIRQSLTNKLSTKSPTGVSYVCNSYRLLTTFYYFANIFIALCYTTNKLTNLAANRDLP